MKKIAICCISYNRVLSLKRLLASLNNASYEREVTLIISIDKSDTDVVERYADEFVWQYGEKRVIKHKENMGLRKHILSCGNHLDEFDALIVLEDDITVSPSFFIYSEQCVENYFDDDRIAGISLYGWATNIHNFMPFSPIKSDSDVYLMQLAQSWGQIWMKKQWMDFMRWYNSSASELSKTSNLPSSILGWSEKSWLKYHIRYCIEQDKWFVYPYTSMSTNNAEAGTNNKNRNTVFQVPILMDVKQKFIINPTIKYDAFFENQSIYDILHLEKSELCVDLYGNKGNREKKRYWLSCRKLGYKIVRSYGLNYKPIEVNVLQHEPGNQIFLYDTSEKVKKCVGWGNLRVFCYFFNYTCLVEHFKLYVKFLINYKQY